MYYYYIDGYTITSELVSSEDADEGTIYTKVETTKPIKRALSLSQMLDYFSEGTPVYISYDDEDGNVAEDTLVTQEFVNSIENITSTTTEEEVVGDNGTITTRTVTRYTVVNSTARTTYDMEYTSVDVTISSVSGNSTFITTLTPRLTNYDLVGVSGWTVAGVSTLLPFRLYVKEGTLYIGLRNIAGSVVTNKVLTVYLTWRLDRTDFVNLEESTEEEVIG